MIFGNRLPPPLVLLFCLAGCTASPPIPSDPTLRLIGHYDMPVGSNLTAQGMPGVPFGGISGIDHDQQTGLFYLLSDDRSQAGPARFLTARIKADLSGIHDIAVMSATPLRDGDGGLFPPPGQGRMAVDPESIRFDQATRTLFWTSEGDPKAGGDPLLTQSAIDGRWLGAVPLPPSWHFDPTGQTGPRVNMVLEGLALLPDGSLMLSLEAPLMQDGPIATPDHGALTRLTHMTRTGQVLAQYAYPLDPIPRRPAGAFADNGISEIARLDDDRLLVLERSGIQAADGHFDFDVRLYLADLSEADNVADLPSLAGSPSARPIAKHLLFASSQLPGGLTPDNLEGMVLFTDPATGQCLLLLVSDNNFIPRQHNRFLLFGLQGAGNCGWSP
jgi:hypothetical protein